MVFEFFHPISGVDECFICIKRLENLIDGAFVYRRVALVSACVSCNECKLVNTDGDIRVVSPDIWG